MSAYFSLWIHILWVSFKAILPMEDFILFNEFMLAFNYDVID